MVVVLGPTPMEAIITSFCTTPAGLLMVSVFDEPPDPFSARIWVAPGAAALTVAVLAPVAPAVACSAVLLPNMIPAVYGVPALTFSVIPTGALQNVAPAVSS